MGPIIRNIAIMGPLFRNMLKTAKTGAGRTYFMALVSFNTRCRHAKHRKWEPEGVHGQLEGCNRNLRPKAAGANNNYLAPKYCLGQMYYTSLIILSKSQSNWSGSSRENAEKTVFLRAKPRAKNNLANRRRFFFYHGSDNFFS